MKATDEPGPAVDFLLNEFPMDTIFSKHRPDYLLKLITRPTVGVNISTSWLTLRTTDGCENAFQYELKSTTAVEKRLDSSF